MNNAWKCLFACVIGYTLALQFPTSATAKTKMTILHSFGSGTDGQNSLAGLIDVGGTLYGTTADGGSYGNSTSGGAVFALDRETGAEAVVYSFCTLQHCTDGEVPLAGLIDVHGTLYGTTAAGGSSDLWGTVFAVDPKSGAERVVYSFCSQASCVDGAQPDASLIDVKGTLYGTTSEGGGGGKYCKSNEGCGTVFALDPNTGTEKVLYSFCSQENCTDGAYPFDSLLDIGGTLYGTAAGGGAGCNTYGCGRGIVFAIDPNSGTETALYSFCSQQNCTDGDEPFANLVDVNGTLYGTTYQGGGSSNCNDLGCGTVFELDLSTGAESVLHAFGSGMDGQHPQAGLIVQSGSLYGTTYEGGAHGDGTVFALDANTGAEKLLRSIGKGADGQLPAAALTYMKGTLYGTTSAGGIYHAGTLFAITKP